MPTPFIMPKFDMDQEKATIVSWKKHEGDFIKLDEAVLVVETDKVAIDVPAPASGILAGICAKEGDVVPVTTVIAQILAEGETLPQASSTPAAKISPEPATTISPAPASQVPATPVASRIAQSLGIDLAKVSASGDRITKTDIDNYIKAAPPAPAGRVAVAATPAARRVARELDVPLEQVQGSGPRGRIQSTDVAALASQRTRLELAAPERTAEIVPLTGIRRTIAERMQMSFHDAPHIALTIEADVSRLDATRARLNEIASRQNESKVSLTALLVRVAAWALAKNPYLNASLVGEEIHLWKDIHMGVATAIPTGLIVPVIRNADRKSIREIVGSLNDLTERARQGKLQLTDIKDGTFTISNLGMFGITQFRAVINPPESAILAVGKTVRKPVVINDQDEVAVHPIMALTLSADHRVIDGVIAAQFLADVLQAIENPEILLY